MRSAMAERGKRQGTTMHDRHGRTPRALTIAGFFGAGLLLPALFPHPVEAKPAAATATPAPRKQTPPPASVSPAMPKPQQPATDPAYAAFDKRDFALAKKLAEEAAARGEPSAHTLLGQLYEQGLGVLQDYGKAAEWYAKGSALGDAHAQFCLGMMLVEGRGAAKNKKRAAEFFQLAAAKNHAHAQYNLALLYAEGSVYPQDYAKVAMWLERAAAQNHAQAQYDLGAMYNSGTGLSKDEVKAEYWIGLCSKGRASGRRARLRHHTVSPRPSCPGKKGRCGQSEYCQAERCGQADGG